MYYCIRTENLISWCCNELVSHCTWYYLCCNCWLEWLKCCEYTKSGTGRWQVIMHCTVIVMGGVVMTKDLFEWIQVPFKWYVVSRCVGAKCCGLFLHWRHLKRQETNSKFWQRWSPLLAACCRLRLNMLAVLGTVQVDLTSQKKNSRTAPKGPHAKRRRFITMLQK